MSPVTIVLLVILAVLIIGLVVLYFLGKKAQKKKAEQERLTIHQRQREGIDAAKTKGKHLGRPSTSLPDNWEEVLALWQAGKITAREAMRRTGMKRTMFYQLARK